MTSPSHLARVFPALLALLFATAIPAPAQDSAGDTPSNEAGAAAATSQAPPTVNLSIREAPITRYLTIIERQIGLKLIPRGAVVDEIIDELLVQGATKDDLLETLSTQLGWHWYQDPSMPENTYELYTDEDYRAQVLPRRVIEKRFYLENISAEQAADFVEPMLSEVGSLAVIPRTNEVIVVDLPQYVGEIERQLAQMDTTHFLRVFTIRYANVDDVAAELELYQSPDGRMIVNARNHTIIVEDMEANIRRMDLLVEQLDQGTILRTYPLNYLSEDDISDLLAALEGIVTIDALLEVNYRTGMIILDDIEEVHMRAEEIIAAFDEPTRQIMLQADVIQVRTRQETELDTQFNLSGDLSAAVADGLAGTGMVPRRSGEGIDTSDGFGLIDYRAEFPTFALDSGGLRFEHLSSHFRFLLTASLTDADTRLLLSPRIQVKDKEQAVIDVGGEVPFVTTTISDNNNAGTRTFTQQAVREGLLLEVTPFITNTGYVELQLRIENNDAEIEDRQVPDGTLDVVARRTQQLDTVLIIPDGATRVIAGLLTTTSSETHTGVPFLSNMPYLGWLFGSTSTSEVRDNLMIFLTPTIIVEAATDFEWRPLYDELPVSGRFRSAYSETREPLKPDDLEMMFPSRPVGALGTQPDESYAPDWLEIDDNLPPLLPEGWEPTEEAVPMPLMEDEMGMEPDPHRGPPPAMEGEDASGEVVSLPLVSEDLQPGSEMTPEDAQWSESTSFRLNEQPRISGTLETSGPDRSETGEQAPERSRSAPASESGRDRPTRETGQRETGQQEGAQPRPAQQESPVRGGTPR